MGELAPEGFGEVFAVVEAELDVAAIVGDVGGAKEVIPDAEGEPEVHAVAMVFGEFFGVVPDVHLGIVEEVFEGAEWDAEVRVIEVADGGGEGVDDEELLNSEPNEGEREILDDAVDDVFHPMIAEVGGEAHFLDGVVNFVEFPKEGDSMEEPVSIPVDEVAEDEEEEELSPDGEVADFYRDEVVDAGYAQQMVEPVDDDFGDGIINDEREEKKVEDHVEGIEPKVLTEAGLVLAPRADEFERKKEEGDSKQPVDVVGEPRVGEFFPEVAGVVEVGLFGDSESLGHSWIQGGLVFSPYGGR